MKRQLHILVAAAAVCIAPAAFASPISVEEGSPTLEIYWRNGVTPDAPIRSVGAIDFEVDGEGNFVGASESFTWGQGAEQDTINVTLANGNFDPFLNFAVGVVDAGTPSIFTFVFSSPLAPVPMGMVSWTLDLAGSFSQGSPNDGGSLAMAAPNTLGVLEGILNATSMAGTGGAAVFPAGGSSTYGPYATAGLFDCGVLGGCTTFSTRLSFLGSGGADALSFTGRFEITEVIPVPAAVWLLGSALGLLGWVRRRAA
jgi:hypothetical protein